MQKIPSIALKLVLAAYFYLPTHHAAVQTKNMLDEQPETEKPSNYKPKRCLKDRMEDIKWERNSSLSYWFYALYDYPYEECYAVPKSLPEKQEKELSEKEGQEMIKKLQQQRKSLYKQRYPQTYAPHDIPDLEDHHYAAMMYEIKYQKMCERRTRISSLKYVLKKAKQHNHLENKVQCLLRFSGGDLMGFQRSCKYFVFDYDNKDIFTYCLHEEIFDINVRKDILYSLLSCHIPYCTLTSFREVDQIYQHFESQLKNENLKESFLKKYFSSEERTSQSVIPFFILRAGHRKKEEFEYILQLARESGTPEKILDTSQAPDCIRPFLFLQGAYQIKNDVELKNILRDSTPVTLDEIVDRTQGNCSTLILDGLLEKGLKVYMKETKYDPYTIIKIPNDVTIDYFEYCSTQWTKYRPYITYSTRYNAIKEAFHIHGADIPDIIKLTNKYANHFYLKNLTLEVALSENQIGKWIETYRSESECTNLTLVSKTPGLVTALISFLKSREKATLN